MAEPKTKPTSASVRSFLDNLEDADRRNDCESLLAMMRELTGSKAVMWGETMVGFGSYHYRYKSGREGDWFLTGFSPRKRDLTVYIMPGFDQYADTLSRLGKFRLGKSCLYLKRLDNVDTGVLRDLVAASLIDMARMYECTRGQ